MNSIVILWTLRKTQWFKDMDLFRLTDYISLTMTLTLNGMFAMDYFSLGVRNGDMRNIGLTEIPTNIPCNLSILALTRNLIKRIEADSFICVKKVTRLDIGYNLITYIAPGAFDHFYSLVHVGLAGNEELSELPAQFGPNTANMINLFIHGITLQTIPLDSYFDQTPKLQLLTTDINLSNDFFDDWINFRYLSYHGSSPPNFTDRIPNIETILFHKVLATKNLPSENAVGLAHLKRMKLKSCDTLPLFWGAVALSNLDVRSCQITNLPDYRHLVSLKTFSPDTRNFHCDSQSCWMLFEMIDNVELASVVQSIVCHAPTKFKGITLRALSPVQLRCFEGKYGAYFYDFTFWNFTWTGSV